MVESQETPEAIPSIGGDVVPVNIDNGSAEKETPEWEQKFIDGQISAKKQQAEARKAETDEVEAPKAKKAPKAAKKGKK